MARFARDHMCVNVCRSERYVGLTDKVLGMPTFGARAPAKVVQGYFGFSAPPLSKPLKYNCSRFVERDHDRAQHDC